MIDVHACLFCGLFHLISCSDAKDRQERANKTLVNVKAGIEHLADKLQHLKAVGISCKQVSSQKNRCRHLNRLRKLYIRFQGVQNG